MIFKPSSLHKLFFTYICPRFYGGAPAAPSNTTSTQTVNQSPWQNPVYQALMLGTADKPGPATSMLNASREQMAQWNAINKTGLTPTAQASLGTWNPAVSAGTSTIVDKVNQQTGKYDPTVNPALYQKDATGQYVPTAPAAPVPGAAQGGLMGLRGYASGGSIDPVQQTVMDLVGRQLSDADLADLKHWSAMGFGSPADLVQRFNGPEVAAWKAAPPEQKAVAYQKIVDAGGNISPSQNTLLSNYNTYKSQIDAGTLKLDASGNPTPNIKQGSTKAETDAANVAFTKATGIEQSTGKAPYDLMDTMKKVAYFDPVTGKSTLADFNAIQNTARNLQTPEQFAAATDMYGKSTAGLEAAAGYKPTDVNATKADVAEAASQGYNAANMQGAAGVSASPLTDYQMKGPSDVNAPTAGTAQMQGPASWLDPGTSQAYMNPYVQNVVNLEKEQANRDYQQQLNQLNAQSVQAGAFGGSRQAIQQSEAARNQAFNLANIEAKGLENAYTQGAQQFNTAQGQQLQAGQANLTTAQQTNLANQSAQIQAMMANQGMDYNTAYQNLQARMGVQNTASQQDLQAAMANQQAQQQTQAANQAAKNAASQFTSGAQNTANLANQQAANTASNAYTQQQLAANQANQQAGLQANQQGIGALQGVASNASGLTGTGSAQNAANLANLGAQGQVAQAEQNLGQSYLDAQSANATSWLNAPTSINAGAVNMLGGQNVQGGTATTTGTAKPASWARGGLIKNGKVSKGSKK